MEVELKDQLAAVLGKLEEAKTQAIAQEAKFGELTSSLQAKLTALQGQYDALDVKLAERHAGDASKEETFGQFMDKHEELKKVMRDKSGSAVIHLDGKQVANFLERKTTISDTAVGFVTPGVLQTDRYPGITTEARQELTVRDVLSARPTTMAFIDYVKVNAQPKNASPQVEAADKGENAVTFTTASEKVKTIATWIPATKQVLDDMSELMGYLQIALPYYVNIVEEFQLLTGDGNDPNLHGLITQGTAFNSALLVPVSAGWNKIDVIGRAIQQVTVAKELAPTFVIMHPTDWWGIRLTKDSYGRYILGDPMQPFVPAPAGTVKGSANLFGLTPVVTTSIAVGTFLVGSGNPLASEIRDRMGMTIEIATQHSDYFAKNLIAIRAEKRVALVVRRPASYIQGSFSTSPA